MDQSIAPPPPTRALQYDGRIGELYGIFLTNLLLTIVTLGIYNFWATTRNRRYMWSRMAFQGQRFEYTGTGLELFLGFLLAGLVLIGIVLGLGGLIYILPEGLNFIPVLAFYAVFAVLAAGAVFSAQRYRLTRTLWCGIRGGMTGSALAYGAKAIGYYSLLLLSLFQLGPWVSVRLAEARINASSFGSAPFSFRGRARKLYWPYLLTLVGMVALFLITGGLVYAAAMASMPDAVRSGSAPADMDFYLEQMQGVIWLAILAYAAFGILATLLSCWYSALLTRHIVGNSALGDVRFASSVSGVTLLSLTLGNLLILLLTLGLGYPIVLHRNARYLAGTLFVYGGLDPAELAQSTLAAPRFGEGMYQQLDAGGAI
ncbi:MAG: DUF898 family protein [Gemmatimonadaceae bacterium]|nr:DUF898 family protein [Acetobacteraceae bacterium]